MVIQGELRTKEGGERVIDTPQGPVRFKMGPLDYFLYGGDWDKFEKRDYKLGWYLGFSAGQHMTRTQTKCAHDMLIWDEDQRIPTKLHPSVPARVVLCLKCGLGLAFKV